MRVPTSFRYVRYLQKIISFIAMFLIIQSMIPINLRADQKNIEPPIWTLETRRKALWLINAPPSLYSSPAGVDNSRPVCGTLGVTPPKEEKEKYNLGSIRVVETAGGLIVAVCDDKGDGVRLVAVDTETVLPISNQCLLPQIDTHIPGFSGSLSDTLSSPKTDSHPAGALSQEAQSLYRPARKQNLHCTSSPNIACGGGTGIC